eukprot:CAMPEP_0116549802 /NCGR_PEP_ID=MMETSP0397-20121206/5081_1 /TAXON_ID=216820 /ORGANISM="Cyclophora tenuis, Strain ECT3854" /LENGTH=182 /DNA_ID=CAMNT_0004074577 /DNA_START=226 /DNA_END=774 /DNA_ORIENTATION=+
MTDYSNQSVAALASNSSVQGVLEVTEHIEVDCSTEVNNFASASALQFEGFPAHWNQTAAAAIGAAIISTYNLLAQDCCDPLFRSLQSIDGFQLMDETGIPIDTSNIQDATAKSNFTVVFGARGRCRGCSPGSGLFDDVQAFGARSYLVPRRVEEGDSCFCDRSLLQPRAPTAAEFVALFALP